MASRFAQEEEECAALSQRECANCGEVAGLLRCSRCRAAWFCGAACQKAYWPLHRPHCARNEFADMTESAEPRFAAWMRAHGKMALLRDAEVERIERVRDAPSASATPGEVMESMYGRADPSPAAPHFSEAEWAALELQRAEEQAQAALMSPQDKAWAALPPIPPGLGGTSRRHRWHQTTSHVELYVRLPRRVPSQEAKVLLQPRNMDVRFGGRQYMGGTLYGEIDLDGSTWFVDAFDSGRMSNGHFHALIVFESLHTGPVHIHPADTGVLHVLLLKRCRRGRYWASAAAARRAQARMALAAPHSSPPQTLPAADAGFVAGGSTNDVDLGVHTASGQQPESQDAAALAVAARAQSSAPLSVAPLGRRATPPTAADTYWQALFLEDVLVLREAEMKGVGTTGVGTRQRAEEGQKPVVAPGSGLLPEVNLLQTRHQGSECQEAGAGAAGAAARVAGTAAAQSARGGGVVLARTPPTAYYFVHSVDEEP